MLQSRVDFIEKVVCELARYNIVGDVADFIGCQFALESNYGNSDLAVKYSNYCGMKLPLVRRTSAVNYGSHDTFAHYSCFSDCVIDYVLCLAYRSPRSYVFETIDSFKAFIKNWYCPEKSYLDRVSSIYVQFKSIKNGK